MSQTQCSLIEHYPLKPRIEFKVTRKSKTKISLVLLDFLGDTNYYLSDIPLSPDQGRKDLLVIVFEDVIGYLKFYKRIDDRTDFLPKYTYYPNQKGTTLTWYWKGLQINDPRHTLEWGWRGFWMPRTWSGLEIDDYYVITFTPGIMRWGLYEKHSGKEVKKITPEAIDHYEAIGVKL